MASGEHAAEERALEGRVPDFFIVGHAKSGTTALYEMLRRHPEIYMPEEKEPMFFARNPPGTVGAGAFEQTGRKAETLAQYTALFDAAAPGQLAGEASTFYLFSERAPARIAGARPDAKIIAILREPASFVYSLHMQLLQNQTETERDLLKAIGLEGARREGRQIPRYAHWPAALMYTDRVRYAEQLRRYHAAFPPEQVLVLIYDDFRADNEGTLRRVLQFLGVEDAEAVPAVEANPSVRLRGGSLDLLVRDVREGAGPLTRSLRGTVRTLTSRRLRETVLYPARRRLLYTEPAPAPPALLRELRARFRDEVLAVSEYLGRDLAGLWGYDDAG